ncbi:hypothetical protein L3Y34_004278 [Caenorhabditis briggsae]|uniref:Uncharacterized protein n=1 Tax=Caenorhabditis briggsae TaxID=6238 RepID=A0AAE9AHC3_CAEBR|nr:hypothetical protein L3Y34_004278 [Caenorhabditis briggsae]
MSTFGEKRKRSSFRIPIVIIQNSSTVTGTTNGGTMDGSKNRKMMMHSTLVRHGAAIEQLLLRQETHQQHQQHQQQTPATNDARG